MHLGLKNCCVELRGTVSTPSRLLDAFSLQVLWILWKLFFSCRGQQTHPPNRSHNVNEANGFQQNLT